MKKVISSILAISLLLISCSDDKNDTPLKPVTTSDLIGTWAVTNISSENGTASGTVDSPLGEVPLNTSVEISGKDYTMSIMFADNPKKISNSGSFTAVAKVSIPILGEKTFEQVISEIPATSGDWKVENNILTTINNGESISVNIVSYNGSQITFAYPIKEIIQEDTTTIPDVKNLQLEGTLMVSATKK